MMRSQGKTVGPILVLLGFEVAAIVGLQALGSAPSMQVPWGDLGAWVNTGSVVDLAGPVLRIMALAIAYWMFVSTALCILAQVSRVPSAIRATQMFTLPSVRRVVTGTLAVSIAGSSVMGFGGVASAATNDRDVSVSTPVITLAVNSPTSTSTTTEAPRSGDLSVPTPKMLPQSATTTTAAPSTTSTSVAPTTTSTAAAPTTTTAAPTTITQAPSTSTTAAPASTVAPDAGADFVATPRPSGHAATTTAPRQSTTSTTSASSAAAPAARAPASTGTQVLGAQEHRVVTGDNLWTISRDALAQSSNRSSSDVSENEVRDYWLKVIDANRNNLRSGDPHWIFPGEVINLPSA